MQIWNVQKFITSYNIIYYKYLKTRINFISFHLQIYDSVRVNHPSVLSRIHPVQGDVSLSDLGLSPEDRIMLIEKVNSVSYRGHCEIQRTVKCGCQYKYSRYCTHNPAAQGTEACN